MRDSLLFIGATGVLGRDFTQAYSSEYSFTGLARSVINTPPNVNMVRTNITQAYWPSVFAAVEKHGVPKHIVYAVYNRKPARSLLDTTALVIEEEIDLQVTALIKLIRALKTYWAAPPAGASLTVVSSMSAFLHSNSREDLFAYSVAKAAQNQAVLRAVEVLPGVRVNAFCPPAFPQTVSVRAASESLHALIQSTENGVLKKMTP